MAAKQQFIVVHYGENKEAIFNPWCSSLTLLRWMRRKCHCDGIPIDLVDLDGNVKNLSDEDTLSEYASDVVIGRQKYVLIRVTKATETEPVQYDSLLNNLDMRYPDVMDKLCALSRPATRGKKEKKKKGKSNWAEVASRSRPGSSSHNKVK